jgi:hypothetical protein
MVKEPTGRPDGAFVEYRLKKKQFWLLILRGYLAWEAAAEVCISVKQLSDLQVQRYGHIP